MKLFCQGIIFLALIGPAFGESGSPIKVTACLNESRNRIHWTLENVSGSDLSVSKQSLPWSAFPFGAEIDLKIRNERVRPVLSTASNRSSVQLRPGIILSGETTLSTMYPSAAARLATEEFVLDWKYEFRPAGGQREWLHAGILSRASTCKSD